MDNEIEIFRTGRFRSIDGRTLSFGDGDLADTASVYDPSLHEAPAVIGHPAIDAPAYGWVKGVRFAEGRLMANFEQFDPQFHEQLRAGRSKKISAAFYEPDDVSNPVPGSYYLRHVGFLGAAPPAVKGLKQAQFAAGERFIAFAEEADAPERGGFAWLSRFIRGQVRAEIARGIDPAAALPVIEEYDMNHQTAFADRERSLADRERQLNERATQLDQRETTVKGRETAFSEQETRTFRVANEAVLEELEQGGRSLPVWRPALLAMMDRMQGAKPIAFGEGSDKVDVPMVEAFHELLGRMPKLVEFAEIARTPVEGAPRTRRVAEFVGPKDMAINDERLDLRNRALAYAELHKIDFVEAVRLLEAEGA